MGFEPQTAGLPLVNPHKRTTKVNFAIVAGVVLFLLIGIAYAIWATQRAATGQPESPSAESRK